MRYFERVLGTLAVATVVALEVYGVELSGAAFAMLGSLAGLVVKRPSDLKKTPK